MKILFVFIGCLAVYSAAAQTRISQGLVVLNNGDTLKGWIDYKGWAKNPDEIVFRKDSLSPDGSKFGVKDISYFEIFDKDIYVRASLTLDMRPVEIPEVWPEEADSTLYDTLFLRVLVKGTPLNLYELVHDKTHYFVRKPDGDFTELEFKVYSLEGGSYRTAFNYRRQLYDLIGTHQKSAEIRTLIDKATYSEDDLVRIVYELNNKDEGTSYTVGSQSMPPLQWYIGLGSGFNSMGFKAAYLPQTRKPEGSAIYSFVTAVDIPLSKRKFSAAALRAEIQLWGGSYQNVTAQYVRVGLGGNVFPTPQIDTFFTFYNLKQFNVTPSLTYIHHFVQKETVRAYFGIGAGINIGSTKTEIESLYKGTIPIYPEKSWPTAGVQLGMKTEGIHLRAALNRGAFLEKMPVSTFSFHVLFKIR